MKESLTEFTESTENGDVFFSDQNHCRLRQGAGDSDRKLLAVACPLSKRRQKQMFSAISGPRARGRGRETLFFVLAAAALFAAAPARAGVAIGKQDWESGAEGWVSEYGNVTLDDGAATNWLTVSWAATTDDPGPSWLDILHAPGTNLYAGSWSTNTWIEFDFWASNVTAGGVQVQWKSTTNANIWGYALNPPAGGGDWTTLTAPLLDWTDWQYPGATEDQYLSDLSEIEWIGVWIYRGSQAAQIYGIDNFMLMIPEPAECLMLAAALLTALSSLRKKMKTVT